MATYPTNETIKLSDAYKQQHEQVLKTLFVSARVTRLSKDCRSFFHRNKYYSTLVSVDAMLNEAFSGVNTVSTQFIITVDILYFVGLLALLAVLLTAWSSSHIRRFSTWYMFLLTWVIEAVAKLLLVGQQTSSVSPQSGLCVVQASLINAVPVLCSFYSVTFIFQTYLTVKQVLKPDTVVSIAHIRWLHALPCTTFLGYFVLSLIIGLRNQTTAQRSPLRVYCHFAEPLAKRITAGLIIALMTIILILEASLMIIFCHAWKAARKMTPRQNTEYFSLDAFVRVILVSIAPLITLILVCFIFLPGNKESAQLALAQSTFPLVAALIFGSQKDIVRSWLFWDKDRLRSQQPA